LFVLFFLLVYLFFPFSLTSLLSLSPFHSKYHHCYYHHCYYYKLENT
jgi:hypothetical protein